MNISEYHPFKSAGAKERYLQLYDSRAKAWPVPTETRMVDTSYGKTFVRISGPVDAPALVLLPGGGCNSLSWTHQIGTLSNHYRTYAVDNIYDCGRSVYMRDIIGYDDYVCWLDELFRALNLGNDIDLMGLSYGASLTAEYALRHPERLHRIVMLAPAAIVQPVSPVFVTRIMLCLIPHPYFMKNFYFWLFRDFIKNNGDDLKLMDGMLEEAMMSARCFKAKRMVQPRVFEDVELRSIKVPALFLTGENEKIYSPRKAVERLNKVAPQIKTETIPNAGHDLIYARKDLVMGKVLDFLKQP